MKDKLFTPNITTNTFVKDFDVILSSRLRLARNIEGFPFPIKLELNEAMQLWKKLADFSNQKGYQFYDLKQFTPLEQKMLVEKHLISPTLLESKYPAVITNQDNSLSVMVNEEDHLRLQYFSKGFHLDELWKKLSVVDDSFGEVVSYSFDEEYGYLTSCPSNLGTGIRASVMLHLPLHDFTRESNYLSNLSRRGIAIRGAYGEGSKALGHFYQISNQRTLGKTEVDFINTVKEVAIALIQRERYLRETWVRRNQLELSDKVHRAYGVLSEARILSEEEAIEKLSLLRLGKSMGLFEKITYDTIDNALLFSKAAFVNYYGKDYENKEKYRADKVREFLKEE